MLLMKRIDIRSLYFIKNQGLSNYLLYEVFPEGASKLQEVKGIDFRIYLIKRDFLDF